MNNGRMSQPEIEHARDILANVRQQISKAANGNQRLEFAVNRYVYKNLMYSERGTPAHRTKLKLAKLEDQQGKCTYSACPFPDRPLRKEDEPELDRIDAVLGYTSQNTVLVHHECHRLSQKSKGFS